jgi:cation:H+ antiporter
MLLDSLAIIAGFVLLIWSADRFICGASATARNFNISPLVIGLTIVGFGTSVPEMLVATFASVGGNPSMGIGNALGSNITNIALILGVAAIVAPLDVHSRILKKELPVLLFASILAFILLLDNHLGRLDGFIMFATLIIIMGRVTQQALRDKHDVLQDEYQQEMPADMPMSKALFWLVLSLSVLVASSKLLVWGAVNIAVAFGISDLVIGLTIIAIGTSLPELATSVAAALKNEHDIAIGNVVGSNLFNTLGVLAIPGVLAPGALAEGILTRDMPVTIVLTIGLFIMAYGFRGAGRINRVEGGVLLMAFLGYQTLLYFTAI